jgi:membrane protein YdbS with pleckstrin-like domain
MEFYLYLNGLRRGPLNEARVQTLLSEGVLLGSDLAADHPDGPWRALSTFLRFSILPAPGPTDAVAGTDTASAAPFVLPIPEPPHVEAASPPEARRDPADPLSPLSLDVLGPYARSTLAPNERAFHKTSLHWIIFVRFAVLALLAFLFMALPFAFAVQALTGSQLGFFALPLPAFIMLPPTLAFAGSELVITDRRVLIKTGVVHRQTLEMFIPRIESIGVEQGFFGRMFDYGTVTIRGTGGSEEPFEAIARPLEFRNIVQRLQSAPSV